MKDSLIYRVLGWLVTVLVPLALILTAVRLLLTPLTVYVEYSTPNFPADPYGFTKKDRIYWSLIALDYLHNREGIEYLGNLEFDDGTPVYNARELQHMVDVKNLVQMAKWVWAGALAVLLGLGVWGYFGGWWQGFRRGLVRGAWLTLIILASVLVLVLLSFGNFFVAFHEALFDPGTWTFYWSDTLIRMFPQRFWRDIFLYMALLAVLPAVAIILLLHERKVK